VAGGHTIIDDVPKYGLAVTGTVHVDKLVRNSTAKEGDALYLTKPIGNGILVSAFRGHKVSNLDEATPWMTMLNRDAAKIMVDVGVSAATDVTGYGLLGHLLEMCEGSGVGAEIRMAEIPLLGQARELAGRGVRPGGTARNEKAFRARVRMNVAAPDYTLACDAQTSGGLLIAVSSEREPALVARFREGGLFYAKIGSITDERGIVVLV
jgi:selenide, water dikinase